MSKELENFKIIESTIVEGFMAGGGFVPNHIKESLDNIEQALQRLEVIDNVDSSKALKCLDKMYDTHILKNVDCYHTIKQALLKVQETKIENVEYKRVLEIIINKKVDVDFLLGVLQYDDGLELYNNNIKSKNRQLTEEEFKLLKRYLGNE